MIKKLVRSSLMFLGLTLAYTLANMAFGTILANMLAVSIFFYMVIYND